MALSQSLWIPITRNDLKEYTNNIFKGIEANELFLSQKRKKGIISKMKCNEMTIKEAQEKVDKWIKTYGVRYFSELTNMACLTEEVGELAKVIARTYGDQSFKKGEKANLGEEMADVLWVLLCLANQTGTDLTDELNKSFDKKTKRDKTRHLNNPKLRESPK